MSNFESGAWNKDVVNNISGNSVSKDRLRKSPSNTSSTRKRLARSLLFRQLWYHILILRYSASPYEPIRMKREATVQAQKKMLKKVQGIEKLEICWWKTCSDVPQSCSSNEDVGKM